MANKPVKIITVENCHAAIWKNEGGEHGIYHTASFSKSFDDDGETKVDGADDAAVSYPQFWEHMQELLTPSEGQDR